MAGAKTLEQANAYLESEFLVWWNYNIAVLRPAATTRIGHYAKNIRWLRRHPWVCVAPRCGSKFGSTHPWRCASAGGTDCDRVPTSSQSAQASGVTSEEQMDGQLPLDQSGENRSAGNPGNDPGRNLKPIRRAGQQRPSHRRVHCIQSLRSRVSPK